MGEPSLDVSAGAQAVLDRARELHGGDDGFVAVNCLLLAFAERHGAMLEDLSGLDATSLRDSARAQIEAGDVGVRMDRSEVLEGAGEFAAARGASKIVERDLGKLALQKSGLAEGERVADERQAPKGHVATDSDAKSGPSDVTAKAVRAHVKTPLLDQIGRDLTEDAAAGKLSPLVGRDHEVHVAVETLCRLTKRNPVLLGPAGVGKTAIVEGLAQMVANSQVPAVLQGMRVIEVKVGSLVSGTGIVGKLEEKMTQVLKEAAGGDVILFIDEIHSILGSGGGGSGMDVAGLLKPALARGDVALIGATTDMEYKRILDQDPALERRFQPVPVSEMTSAQALEVLRVQRDRFHELRGVDVSDEELEWLVSFAESFLRNRHFPDKAIDLLEQCVGHAMVDGQSRLDLETCQTVAQELVGMPLGVEERLQRLRVRLTQVGVLSAEDAGELLDRLALTVGSHDFSPDRPNAVLLLIGDAAAHATTLAGLISDALFGSAQRVISIDLAGYMNQDESALTRLLGMPYGYVGADLSQGQVQRLASQPWSTVVIRNVDRCGSLFVDLVADALVSGHFTDAHGAKQYISDAVVILTAETLRPQGSRQLGFVQTDVADPSVAAERLAADLLGQRAARLCQVVSQAETSDDATRSWIAHMALPDLATRYARDGLDLRWDDSVVEWLMTEGAAGEAKDDWAGLLERRLSPVLVRLFKERPTGPVVVQYADGRLMTTVLTEGE